MQLWKLILAYDGTQFHGWQIQPRLATIQGTLGAALRRITGETVLPQGSGRTDAGVHALGQVASVTLAAKIPPENLLRALNRALPAAIRVLAAEHATVGFHARHSAVSKQYEYRIFPQMREDRQAASICPPILAPFVWDCPWPFSLGAAREAATHVLGEHDFTSFAALDPDLTERRAVGADQNRSAMRTIFNSTWRAENGLMIYTVSGSGFLHHMVRNLVGTFVDVAAGRTAPGAVPKILAGRSRSLAGPTAPPQGLFLVNVEYPT